MFRLYDFLPSGNGYKVRLVLKYLSLPYELVEKNILAGETRTPEFLAMNPHGRIPLLEVPGKGYLAESHAIISFLAEGSDLIPNDAFARAQMWQWLCFEQYHIEPNIGTARYWTHVLGKSAAELGQKLIDKLDQSRAALDVVERHLKDRRFMVADRYTLADISLQAYIHIAPEAGISLHDYPQIEQWLERLKQQRNWAPITRA